MICIEELESKLFGDQKSNIETSYYIIDCKARIFNACLGSNTSDITQQIGGTEIDGPKATIFHSGHKLSHCGLSKALEYFMREIMDLEDATYSEFFEKNKKQLIDECVRSIFDFSNSSMINQLSGELNNRFVGLEKLFHKFGVSLFEKIEEYGKRPGKVNIKILPDELEDFFYQFFQYQMKNNTLFIEMYSSN